MTRLTTAVESVVAFAGAVLAFLICSTIISVVIGAAWWLFNSVFLNHTPPGGNDQAVLAVHHFTGPGDHVLLLLVVGVVVMGVITIIGAAKGAERQGERS